MLSPSLDIWNRFELNKADQGKENITGHCMYPFTSNQLLAQTLSCLKPMTLFLFTLPLLVQTFSLTQAESWRGSQQLQTFCVRILQPLSLGGWEEERRRRGFALQAMQAAELDQDGRVQMLTPLSSLYRPIQQPSN